MNHLQAFSVAARAVIVTAAVAAMMSTSALGACRTTLRGELVQVPDTSHTPFPLTFLFFTLTTIRQDGKPGAGEPFQSFAVPNTQTTFPIPFALDIDSPRDCPSELELSVDSYDSNPPPRFTFGGAPLRGRKTLRLDGFETISVWGPKF